MSVKKSLAWLGVAQLVGFVAQFGSSVIVARFLTPHETGIFAVGVAVVGILSIMHQFGLTALIVREERLTSAVAATAFTINASLAVVLSVATAIAGALGTLIFDDRGVGSVLSILALTPLLGIPSFLPGAMLEREGQFRSLAAASTAAAVLNSIVTVVLAFAGLRYMSLAYASLLSSVCLSILLIVIAPHHFSMRVGLRSWRHVLGFGTQMFAVSGVSALAARANEVLLGRLLGLSGLGLYNRASGLNNMLWANIHYLISRVVLVDFAALTRSGQPLRERYLRIVAMVTGLLWPAFAGLAVVAEPFIVVVYGSKWVAAANPLVWLALASMILVSITMTWELFTATGNLAPQTRIEAARAPTSVALFVAGTFFGLEGVAFSRVLDALFAVVLYRPHVQRMTGTSFADFVPIYRQSALLTLMAIGPSIAVSIFHRNDPPLFQLGGAIIIGMLLWSFTLFKTNHPIAQETLQTIRNRFGKWAPI